MRGKEGGAVSTRARFSGGGAAAVEEEEEEGGGGGGGGASFLTGARGGMAGGLLTVNPARVTHSGTAPVSAVSTLVRRCVGNVSSPPTRHAALSSSLLLSQEGTGTPSGAHSPPRPTTHSREYMPTGGRHTRAIASASLTLTPFDCNTKLQGGGEGTAGGRSRGQCQPSHIAQAHRHR